MNCSGILNKRQKKILSLFYITHFEKVLKSGTWPPVFFIFKKCFVQSNTWKQYKFEMCDSNTISCVCYVQSSTYQASCGSLHPKPHLFGSVLARTHLITLRTSPIFFHPSFASRNAVTYLWKLTIRCRSSSKWRLIASAVYQLQRNAGLKINCDRIQNNQVSVIMPFNTGSVVQS